MQKKIMAGILALTMAASSFAAVGTGVMTAAATTLSSQELGESTFNSGKGLPWHVCENATGKMKFDISGGTYNITIVNQGGTSQAGVDRWDCQFRHRGLTIEAGHKYRITYSLKASNSGHIYAKIGNMVNDNQELWHGNGTVLNMPTLGTNATQEQVEQALKNASSTYTTIDYGQGWDYWKNVQIPANQWVTYAYEFTADQTVKGTAEYTFHFGGQGTYTPWDCFPAGTVLQFDNMALIDLTDNNSNYEIEDEYVRNKVLVNQLGYIKGMNKKATLVVNANDNTAKTFKVISAKTGKTVYTGKSTPKGYDNDSGDYVHILDFSSFDTEDGDYQAGQSDNGAYYIECNGEKSYKFNIGAASENKSNWLYDGLLDDALNYFYQNRSGIDIESQYITSGDKNTLAHSKGHSPDIAYVQSKWVKSYANESEIEKGTSLDVTGGWYDAGDHGKYVVNGGISVWTLQNMYERAKLTNKDTSKLDDGTLSIPENSNGIPDILDETKYEMDFLLKMQRADGMVYHKIHDYKWTGLAVAPYEDTLTRIVKPVTTCATLNLAATGAQSYRLWKDIDSYYANKCLEAAKKAYSAAKQNPNMFAPLDQAIGGGAYGDTYAEDDFYWAACELYTATGDKTYYNDIKQYKNTNAGASADDKAFSITTSLVGGENSKSKSSFNWGSTAGLGTLTLSLYSDMLSSTEAATVKSSITKAADEYIKIENEQGYGIPYEPTTFKDEINCGDEEFEGYEWGSNSMVVNNAIVMAYAADLNKDNSDKYANGVVSALDYIFGRNAGEYSYVTGYGDHATQYPHHRYWSWLLDKTFPKAPSGVLSGGPNSAMPDPWIKGAGYKPGTLAPQLCYLDHIESWGTNECTINWNAPLAWVVNYMEDYTSAGNDGGDEQTKNISDCTITLGQTSAVYNGNAIKPSVTVKSGSTTLKNGTDYTVAYSNNIKKGTAVVTITGKGNYTGTVTKNFTITQRSTKNCDITLSSDEAYFRAVRVKPVVKLSINGKQVDSSNYTVVYLDNLSVGTATVKITGKNNLKGTVTKTFKIVPRSIANCTIELDKSVSATKPAVSVYIGENKVYSGNYTVAYKTVNGKKYVVLTGKNNLKGTVTKVI